MGKKITFFYHPHTYEIDPSAQLGLGLLSLATYAKELGADVSLINCQSKRMSEAKKLLPSSGILCFYSCLVDVPIINELIISARASGVEKIYVGGPIGHSPELIVGADAVVSGPGEPFIFNVIKTEYEPSGLIKTKSCNLAEYPIPDRTMLGFKGGKIFKGLCEDNQESTTLLTSRGCVFGCAFCSSGTEEIMVDYPISRVEKELEQCLSLNIRAIRVSDDNLIRDKKRLFKICSLFKEAGVTWRGSIRTYPNDEDIYQTMRDAGCLELSFGIESGDQSVLSALHKGSKVDWNTSAVIKAKRFGIKTRALMMMGTPFETEKTLILNMQWIQLAQPDMVSLKIFVPYPGTKIYKNPEKYRCRLLPILDANNSAYRPDGSEAAANIENYGFSAEQMTKNFHIFKNFLEKRGLENRG